MLARFASACLVCSIAIAVGASGVFAFGGLRSERFVPVLATWCAAPCVWGLWALLTPQRWIPSRIPVWGAILGAIAGTLAAVVLNVPSRVLGQPVPMGTRVGALIVLVAFYYGLWHAVRMTYERLMPAGKSKGMAA